MDCSFTIKQLLMLARLGSRVLVSLEDRGGYLGIMPGADSDTFDDIEAALTQKFPDGVIVEDIS